jgi:Flp pilus assembly protein TadD
MAEKERDKDKAAQSIEALVKKLQARQLTKEELIDAAEGKAIIAQILGITPDELYELATKGFTLLQAGYFKEAEATFEALSFLNGLEPYFHNALGVAHLAQKKFDKAEKCFMLALRLNPKEPSYYVNLGEVFLKTDRIEAGIRSFEEADRLDPEKKDFFVNRARMLMDFMKKEAEGGSEKPAEEAAAPEAKPEKTKGKAKASERKK